MKLSLAQQSVKMPIFAAFLFCYKNFAKTKKTENGNTIVQFYDGSAFTLFKDGTMKTTWFVQRGEMFHKMFGYFLASSEKEAKQEADKVFSKSCSYWNICSFTSCINMAGL